MQILHKLDLIKAEIEQALNSDAYPIAAFDADNTLWNTDMGENFFQYLIDNQLVPLPNNPWQHYLSLRNGDNPSVGYLWLAQILKNTPLNTVRQWSKDCVSKIQKLPIFKEQEQLIKLLRSYNIEIFIVTASVKWGIEAAAQHYGIDHDHVIGVETTIENGMVTDIQGGPVTWEKGKVEGLLAKTNNKRPLLAAGNTAGDAFLLEASSHIKIAIQSVEQGHMIYPAESALHKTAIKNAWFTHKFNK